VDAESAPDLRARLEELARERPDVIVVDLALVEFLDSSGLSALVTGLKALRGGGGELRLSAPRPQALTALRLTLLDRVFAIYETAGDALATQ
jgi:anti-anti-sigma factor